MQTHKTLNKNKYKNYFKKNKYKNCSFFLHTKIIVSGNQTRKNNSTTSLLAILFYIL
jgi:hypothetical protein